MATHEPETTQEERPTVEMIETSLITNSLRLKFPPVLEAMFHRDIGPDRRRMVSRCNIISLIAYDMMVFAYFRDLPDVAWLTVFVQLAVVTPLTLISTAYNMMARSSFAREFIPVFIAVLSLVAGLVVNRRSTMPVALMYHFAPLLTLLYVNVVVSVRFSFAVWTTVIVLAITFVDLNFLHESIPHAKAQIASAIVLAAVMTLLSNYRVDRDLRRAYLLNVRERLRRDETARMAELQAMDFEARRRASEVLETNTRSFSTVASAALDDVAQVSGEMRTLAEQLTQASGITAERAASMAAGAQMASSQVAATATAVRDLAESAAKVSHVVAGSIEMASRAVERAEQTTTTIARLSDAASRIGAVVTIIRDIAGRTKLLALNAMIEAARAGPAGLGFSVVAEEVKMLALQAAVATETITEQIGAIQACTAEAVGALQGIDATINQISGVATDVSAVMRQQAAATEEISRNVVGAAQNASEVSGTAVEVQRDAEVTGSVAARVLFAAGAVGERELGLRAHVADFLTEIRAA